MAILGARGEHFAFGQGFGCRPIAAIRPALGFEMPRRRADGVAAGHARKSRLSRWNTPGGRWPVLARKAAVDQICDSSVLWSHSVVRWALAADRGPGRLVGAARGVTLAVGFDDKDRANGHAG
jgi:hypothetical protein